MSAKLKELAIKSSELLEGFRKEYESLQCENKKLRKCVEYSEQCFGIIPKCSSESAIINHAKRGLRRCIEDLKQTN